MDFETELNEAAFRRGWSTAEQIEALLLYLEHCDSEHVVPTPQHFREWAQRPGKGL